MNAVAHNQCLAGSRPLQHTNSTLYKWVRVSNTLNIYAPYHELYQQDVLCL